MVDRQLSIDILIVVVLIWICQCQKIMNQPIVAWVWNLFCDVVSNGSEWWSDWAATDLVLYRSTSKHEWTLAARVLPVSHFMMVNNTMIETCSNVVILPQPNRCCVCKVHDCALVQSSIVRFGSPAALVKRPTVAGSSRLSHTLKKSCSLPQWKNPFYKTH